MDYTSETDISETHERAGRRRSSRKVILLDEKDAENGNSNNGKSNNDNRDIDLKKESPVSRKSLVNKLNYFHFKNKFIHIQFQRPEDKRIISFTALPQPCFGKHLVCLWENPEIRKSISDSYHFKQFELATNDCLICVPAAIRAINHKGICITLPEKAVGHTYRKVVRYACPPLKIMLIQNGMIFNGILKDFSISSFRVELYSSMETPLHWINAVSPVNLVVMADETTVYSGECTILKNNENASGKDLVLAPSKASIQRFPSRVHRSKRTVLKPSPDIEFYHPVTGGMVSLKALDVSGSGLAIEDDEENSALLPGLIIPALTIRFANSFSFTCRAQVLYNQIFAEKDKKPFAKCGIVFLKSEPEDQMKLLSILHNAENQNIYLCNRIDTDKLWELFFDTGFIYPEKYAFLSGCGKELKKTYKDLYSRQSNISRHFTWEKKGQIIAHLAMLRFYEKSWLIHHLAARTSRHIGAGIEILNQLKNFTLDSHRLVSVHMDYLFCYFRPKKRFPDHFFGGIARNASNPKACSIDSFAYMHFRKNDHNAFLPEPWRLEKPHYNDFIDFKFLYENTSGGLMLNALDMLPDEGLEERKSLSCEYREQGLIRERRIYALKKNDCLKALIMANISNIALNLSDLTNCISLFIIDKNDVAPDVLYKALSITAGQYKRRKLPLLVYPLSYVYENQISYTRIYQLWAMNMKYSDECFMHYENLF